MIFVYALVAGFYIAGVLLTLAIPDGPKMDDREGEFFGRILWFLMALCWPILLPALVVYWSIARIVARGE